MAQAISFPKIPTIGLSIPHEKISSKMVMTGIATGTLIIFAVGAWLISNQSTVQTPQNTASLTQQQANNFVPAYTMNNAPAMPSNPVNNNVSAAQQPQITLSFDALMPGNPAPTTMKCGSSYQAAAFG